MHQWSHPEEEVLDDGTTSVEAEEVGAHAAGGANPDPYAGTTVATPSNPEQAVASQVHAPIGAKPACTTHLTLLAVREAGCGPNQRRPTGAAGPPFHHLHPPLLARAAQPPGP